MGKKIAINVLAAFALAATAAYGALFKVEVPADLTKEDVLNPTAEVTARLDALLREKIAADPDAADLGAVVFTKDGELIYRAGERTETDDWSDNRLILTPAPTAENRFLWPENEGSWAAANWHLHEVGQEHGYNGVYDLAQDMFGYPFYPGNLTVYVEWDPTLQVEEGYYNITTQTIYLKNWRTWWEHQNGDFCDDAAVLTRCMLQAWHHAGQCVWDHFGAMRLAAWVAIHNWLGDRGYELGFNDLYHDDQRDDRPYYKCLDNYNTEELGTRLLII